MARRPRTLARTLSFAALALGLTLGVGARTAQGRGPSTQEVVAPAAPAALAARRAQFERRNPGWRTEAPVPGQLRPDVRGAQRVAVGTPKAVTAAEALAAAREFVRANADLLGLPVAAATAQARVDDRAIAGRGRQPARGAHWIYFEGELPDARAPHLRGLSRRADLVVVVFDDGRVGAVWAGWGVDVPDVRLATTPPLAAGDPKVLAHVVGAPFLSSQVVLPDGTRTQTYTVHPEAPVRTDEIVGHTLDVVRFPNVPATFRLVWVVDVRRGDETNRFYVDASTGDLVVRTPEPTP